MPHTDCKGQPLTPGEKVRLIRPDGKRTRGTVYYEGPCEEKALVKFHSDKRLRVVPWEHIERIASGQ